jgi:conjugal transfer pilus assembly protein TraF
MTRRVLGLALAATGLLLQASALAAPSTRTTALDYPSAWRCDQAKFNWYCDVDEARAEETPAPEPAKKAKTREDEAIERLEAWQKELKAKRALSILEPTPENVRAYIEAQEKMMQSASVYSDVWRRVIWQNPDLNYELKRPVNNAAIATYTNGRKAAEKKTLDEINKEWGVFFWLF